MVEQLIKQANNLNPLNDISDYVQYLLNPNSTAQGALEQESQLRLLVGMLDPSHQSIASRTLAVSYRSALANSRMRPKSGDAEKELEVWKTLAEYWQDHYSKAEAGQNPFRRENHEGVKMFLAELTEEETLLRDALIIDHALLDQTALGIVYLGRSLIMEGRRDLLSGFMSKVAYSIKKEFEKHGTVDDIMAYLGLLKDIVIQGNGVDIGAVVSTYMKHKPVLR